MTVWQGGVGAREKPGQGLHGSQVFPVIKDPSALDLHHVFPQRAPTIPTSCLLAHTFP